jgi:hypothetical protein
MRDTIREALTTDATGPKVDRGIERMHAQQAAPREASAAKAIREGRRVEAPRFGVDEAVCTATTPAFAYRAARRCRSRSSTIRCGTTPSRASTQSAWAAATAARSPTPRPLPELLSRGPGPQSQPGSAPAGLARARDSGGSSAARPRGACASSPAVTCSDPSLRPIRAGGTHQLAVLAVGGQRGPDGVDPRTCPRERHVAQGDRRARVAQRTVPRSITSSARTRGARRLLAMPAAGDVDILSRGRDDGGGPGDPAGFVTPRPHHAASPPPPRAGRGSEKTGARRRHRLLARRSLPRPRSRRGG